MRTVQTAPKSAGVCALARGKRHVGLKESMDYCLLCGSSITVKSGPEPEPVWMLPLKLVLTLLLFVMIVLDVMIVISVIR